MLVLASVCVLVCADAAAGFCAPSCDTCTLSDADSCVTCPQGYILSAPPVSACIPTACDIACTYGCDAPTVLPHYDTQRGVVSSLQCTGPMFQRCGAGYMPSLSQSIGCEGACFDAAPPVSIAPTCQCVVAMFCASMAWVCSDDCWQGRDARVHRGAQRHTHRQCCVALGA